MQGVHFHCVQLVRPKVSNQDKMRTQRMAVLQSIDGKGWRVARWFTRSPMAL